jgi:hypothetical protein
VRFASQIWRIVCLAWANGRYNDLSLDTETYPSGCQVETCYDSASRVNQVLNLSATNHPAYASLGCSLSGGTITATNTMGNNPVETDTTNVRMQTTNIQVGSAMTLAFNYGTTNNNGNLLSQTITRGSQTWVQSYNYDSAPMRIPSGDTQNRPSVDTCPPMAGFQMSTEENPTTISCGTTGSPSGSPNWARTYGYDPWANGWVASNTNSTLPAAINK